MSAGVFILVLFIGGSVISMVAARRGGQSHGMGMGCCGGHGAPTPDRSTAEPHEQHAAPLGESSGSPQAAEPAAPARRHRGC